jgi:heme/copper-type cytochrome/quinol oxidase subunit 4
MDSAGFIKIIWFVFVVAVVVIVVVAGLWRLRNLLGGGGG